MSKVHFLYKVSSVEAGLMHHIFHWDKKLSFLLGPPRHMQPIDSGGTSAKMKQY